MLNLNESLISFAEAAKRLPGRPHVNSLHRWRLRGVRGVRLESVLIGGKRFTSVEALQRFAQGCTETSASPTLSKAAAEPGDHGNSHQAHALEELDRAGI